MTLVRALWIIMGILILGGGIVIAIWGIPAPSVRVEKIIVPSDKLSS